MSDFYVHDSTQEENGSPLFDSIFDNANSRLDQERVLRSRNFATVYLGNMTSHLYPLLLIIFNYCLYSLILCSHPADPRLHWTFGPKNGLVQWKPCYYDMLHGPSVH